MALKVSTTGTDVTLNDLGITITHPTTDRDLSLEFTAIELRDSDDLSAAIAAGDLDANDGTVPIYSSDYDPDELLLQELGIRGDTKYISNDELGAVGVTEIVSGVFPIGVNSTASVTRNVYVPTARWVTWELEPGDLVTLTGNPASGQYTVESISDQQNFIVEEAITDETGGDLSIYHPVGATRVGVDDSEFTTLEGDDVQEVLEDIDLRFTQSGFSDQYVKVSATDTSPDFLENQLTVTDPITLTKNDPGGDESLDIGFDGELDDLSDVDIDSPVSGQHLEWDGNEWVANTPRRYGSALFSRAGRSPAGTWLWYGHVSSNVVGATVPSNITSAIVRVVEISNEDISTFELGLYEHDGDEINLTLLATAQFTAVRTAEILDPEGFLTAGKQLAIKVISGEAKNLAVRLGIGEA